MDRSPLTDKIAVLEVEAVQLVTRLLGVDHVLIHDKSGSLGVVRNTLADLAGRRMSEYAFREQSSLRTGDDWSMFTRRPTYRMGPNLPNRSKSCSAVTL